MHTSVIVPLTHTNIGGAGVVAGCANGRACARSCAACARVVTESNYLELYFLVYSIRSLVFV